LEVKEWIAVLKAADAAARWHVHQRRNRAAERYVNHLLESPASWPKRRTARTRTS